MIPFPTADHLGKDPPGELKIRTVPNAKTSLSPDSGLLNGQHCGYRICSTDSAQMCKAIVPIRLIIGAYASIPGRSIGLALWMRELRLSPLTIGLRLGALLGRLRCRVIEWSLKYRSRFTQTGQHNLLIWKIKAPLFRRQSLEGSPDRLRRIVRWAFWL